MTDMIARVRYAVGDAFTRLRWHPFAKSPHRRYDGLLVQVSDGYGVGIARIQWAPEFTSFQLIEHGRLMGAPRWWRLLSAPPSTSQGGASAE